MKTWKLLKFRNRKWANTIQWNKITPGVEKRPLVAQPGLLYSDLGAEHLQAARILTKFGGARELMRALTAIGRHRNAATIFKWTYPTPKGTGGLIPSSAWGDVIAAARHEGIVITTADMEVSFGHTPPEEGFVQQKRFAERYPRQHGGSYMTKQLDAERHGERQMLPRKNWIKRPTVAQERKAKKESIHGRKVRKARKAK